MKSIVSLWNMRKGSGMFKKAFLIYIVLAIIPTVLVTVAATFIYTRGRSTQSHQLVERYARQGETIILERTQMYENVFYRLLADKEFISLCEQINAETDHEYSTAGRKAADLMQTFIYTYSDIRGAAFISDAGDCISSSKWYSSSGDMSWTDPENSSRIWSCVTNMEQMTFLAMENLSRYSLDFPDYVILMGMPVRNLVSKQRCGVLLFALSQKILLFENIPSLENSMNELVIDDEQRILAGAPDAFINGSLDEYLKECWQDKHVMTYSHGVEGTGWTIISIMDQEAGLRDNLKFISIVLALMVVITATFFLITFHVYGGYIREVQIIAAGIEHYDANVPGKMDIVLSGDDELRIIVKRFNEMADRANSLVETLKERNEEIHVAETNRRRAEIKALEAQINPHFLYNTLDSINWRAIDHGEEEISNMLGMLGSLLRYSISNIDMIVLLRAEIEWVRKYVFLQQERFNYSFECEYCIEEEALDFPIYKMLLQPLVENSILHAFAGMNHGGMIRIIAKLIGKDWLEIVVEDNGCGMSPEILAKMQLEAEGKTGKDAESIGISNVASRLRIYYQDEASFRVESTEGSGTKMTIQIHRKERE